MTPDSPTRKLITRVPPGAALLGLALALGLFFGSRGLFDEGTVSMQGDMPRFLMNGVFVADFLASPRFTVDGVLSFAEHYFARYPALSIGHHPPLLAVLLAPFYLVLGVSVAAARTAIICCFAASTILLYAIAARQYSGRVAGWAALIFAVHPFMVSNAQVVMSDLPGVMMVLATWYVLLRFREGGRLVDYLAFVGLAVAGLGMKQLTGFLWPAYGAVLLLDCRHWFKTKRILWATGIGAALVVPLVVGSVLLSPYNYEVVYEVITEWLGILFWHEVALPIFEYHLAFPLAIPVGLGLWMAFRARVRAAWLLIFWILSVLAGVVFITGPYDVARYAIYAVPAYCLLAASTMRDGPRWQMVVATALAIVVVGAEVRASAAIRPTVARGYEAAAQAIVTDLSGPTVLYSASVDTGYFIFFVRKHDPGQRLVILRSDKVLATSLMGRLADQQRIGSREEIYPILDQMGTKYVVIEDRPSGAAPLDWLREEVKGARFAERKRIPFVTTDRRLRGIDIVLYQYLEAKPADPNAEIDMGLPLVERDLRVRLSDLMKDRN